MFASDQSPEVVGERISPSRSVFRLVLVKMIEKRGQEVLVASQELGQD